MKGKYIQGQTNQTYAEKILFSMICKGIVELSEITYYTNIKVLEKKSQYLDKM